MDAPRGGLRPRRYPAPGGLRAPSPAGAIHIASDDIETEAPRRLQDRGRTVVVYCGSTACKRSEKAAARLDTLGYRDVREYVEGRQDWEAAGLPVQAGADPEEPG